jgi:steroid delta-isomerase-like uncharacterized protein
LNENERMLQEFFDIANSHAPDALDRIQELLNDDLVYSSPITGPTDQMGMRSLHEGLWKAFPDFLYSVQRTIAQGDTVVAQCVFKGDHRGELMGIAPTNRNIAMPLAFVVDFREGKILRWDSYFDVAGMLRQLGAPP